MKGVKIGPITRRDFLNMKKLTVQKELHIRQIRCKNHIAIILTTILFIMSSALVTQPLLALPDGAVARLGKGGISWRDRAVQFSSDGTLLAVATSIGVYLYDTQTLDEVAFLETNAQMTSVSFSPDGGILACGSWDKTIKLWDVATRQLLDTLTGNNFGVNSVTFSPDGSLLASGSSDDTIKLWGVKTRQILATLVWG